MSLYLVFDLGNTRLKWAAVESTQNIADRNKKLWAHSGSISTKSFQSTELRAELSDYISKTLPKPDAIAFCCVAGDAAIENLRSLFPQWQDLEWQQFTGSSPYEGLRTLYQDPSKLGADRWAALIGARALSSTNTLVINAGTATTIDLLGGNGVHYGGWILPGLSLMQESLQQNTAQLPLPVRASKPEAQASFGSTTDEAIMGGCDAAQMGAILRAAYLAKRMNHPVERIWLDGGNAQILANEIKQFPELAVLPVEPIEGLVLRGLWAWLLQNLKATE
ncbi:type III pantothenate kinase [Polynucleobacter bastaniensis]|jgi:type III pantothenate kinase|uniref:type III pantothenate kinase n=1 Tax=Polynucleobacter bastaniensis TaxID=2081039 RepID=UPI001C0CD59F|nr:type III pantothenate kinase [Polynucleobacter bastaniensis]MBU3596885.1 type III pantothenate kinase [Polynucleobacter bastaniensis]